VALTHLTRRLLPAMIQRRRGKIMNLSSMAAFVPGPLMAVYYASKAYVLSLSLALSDECRDKGVSVTVVCPGPTETEFFSRASIGGRPLFSAHMMSAPAVAKIGYRAMLAGKPMSVTGLANSFLAQTTRLVPRMFAGHMAGKRNRMRDAKT
jgi:short-subunit dehydrogenase